MTDRRRERVKGYAMTVHSHEHVCCRGSSMGGKGFHEVAVSTVMHIPVLRHQSKRFVSQPDWCLLLWSSLLNQHAHSLSGWC